MKYKPNIDDSRVKARIKTALGFSLAIFSTVNGKPMSTLFIDKHLGRQNTPLGKFLRTHLLICTDSRYSKDDKICKSYIVNRAGADYLIALSNGLTSLSYRKWLDSIDHEYVLEIEDDNLIMSSIHEPIEDEKIIDYFLKKEYADQLESKEFIYNDKSNRLWNAIQNIKRDIKERLFTSYELPHTYDIEACAPTLLLQYARQIGFDLWTPCIDEYLKDKTSVRERIARDAELSIKQVKVFINALWCGAKLGKSKHYAITKLVNDDAIIEYLKQDDYIIRLREEIKALWAWIYEVETTKRYTTDKKGHRRRIAMTAREKWTIYFQLERKALESIKRYLKATDNKVFTEHDGFSTTNEIDIEECIAFVKEDIGFDIKLSYKNLANEKAQTLDAFNPVSHNSSVFAGAHTSELCSHSLSLSFFSKTSFFYNHYRNIHYKRHQADLPLVCNFSEGNTNNDNDNSVMIKNDHHYIRKKQLDTS